jgi:hypothetical protein
MRKSGSRLAIALVLLGCASLASAQTADQVIERCLTAVGGRAALLKLKSRSTVGTITLSTPMGDIEGSVELLNAAPNKSRSLIKADLTALGAGQLVLDQRFDGTSGYAMDSLQGNRDITGTQLENMRNGSFPHPFLTYKDMGVSAQLRGKEKVGDRDAFVLVLEPTSGSAVRQYIDAETYLPMKVAVTVDVPQLGTTIEQTTELSDYRSVDGVKLPFKLHASSSIQSYTIVVSKIEHNVPIDDALFSKPARQ